jgi:hypothetical protein
MRFSSNMAMFPKLRQQWRSIVHSVTTAYRATEAGRFLTRWTTFNLAATTAQMR